MVDELTKWFAAAPITDSTKVLQFIRWKRKINEKAAIRRQVRYEDYKRCIKRKRMGL